ncbi:MAG: MFS transporter [Nesterenkonia sp.]|nr:MFS transporter [Nesterenkonia sp.]
MRRGEARAAGPGLLITLVGAIGIGPVLTYGLSATSELVISDLGISAAQFGLLATVCFACAAVGNATLGRLADRLSDMVLMTAIFLLAAAALGLAGIPGGYALLVVAFGLSGVAQSFTNGVTNRILVQRVPASRRIGWAGVKQSGVQASQLVASLSFPLLAVWVGWRGASLVSILLAAALLVLTWRVLRVTPAVVDDDAETETEPAADGSSRHGAMVWALAGLGFLTGVGVQATNVYVPLFAVRELGFSLVLGGATAAVAGAIGVVARIGWAHVMSRGVPAPTLLAALAATALAGAGAFFAAGATGWSALLWLAVALHGTSALGVSVVLMGTLLRSIPASSMASASGVVTAGMFGGFTLGPVVMGVLISGPGGFQLGWTAVGGIYLVCAVLGLLLRRRLRS